MLPFTIPGMTNLPSWTETLPGGSPQLASMRFLLNSDSFRYSGRYSSKPTMSAALSLTLSSDDHSMSFVMLSRISSMSSLEVAGTWSTVYPRSLYLSSMSLTLWIVSSPAAPPILPESGLDWYIRMAILLSFLGVRARSAHLLMEDTRWAILSGIGVYIFGAPRPCSLLANGTVMICPSTSGHITFMAKSDLAMPSAISS